MLCMEGNHVYRVRNKIQKVMEIESWLTDTPCISSLSSDPPELARTNNISQVPLIRGNSSRSGQYYRGNTSYTIPSIYNTYFTIANYTFEGLATFNSLIRENNCCEFSLDVGMKPRVLLRCAWPTSNKTKNSTIY